jgi:hypothetical protein
MTKSTPPICPGTSRSTASADRLRPNRQETRAYHPARKNAVAGRSIDVIYSGAADLCPYRRDRSPHPAWQHRSSRRSLRDSTGIDRARLLDGAAWNIADAVCLVNGRTASRHYILHVHALTPAEGVFGGKTFPKHALAALQIFSVLMGVEPTTRTSLSRDC